MYTKLVVKKTNQGVREMAQWSRALMALPEDLGSIPYTAGTYMAGHNHL